jgi:hypothetical protein
MTDVPHDAGEAPAAPDEVVAGRISADLQAEGLLDEADAEEFAARLAAGAVTADDWRLMADLGAGGGAGDD